MGRADDIPGTRSPGRPCAATSAARTGGSAPGISLAPPLPLIPSAESCCLFTGRLGENRLANIDSPWRKDGIKRMERRKGSCETREQRFMNDLCGLK